MPVSHRRQVIRKVALAAALLVGVPGLPVGGYVAYRQSTGNFGVVQPGRVYRAGQMGADALAARVAEHRVRTVLNLRGPNPKQEWYRAEKQATLEAGATLIDVPLASDQYLTRLQARRLVEILETCEYPLLVHCQWGAERTGLVAAMVELLRPGSSLAEARDQFATRYLFLPVKDGRIMLGHLDRYAEALAALGEPHSPERFRRWLTEDYRPIEPSREFWPYDPYPLSVTHRPGGDSTEVWGPSAEEVAASRGEAAAASRR